MLAIQQRFALPYPPCIWFYLRLQFNRYFPQILLLQPYSLLMLAIQHSCIAAIFPPDAKHQMLAYMLLSPLASPPCLQLISPPCLQFNMLLYPASPTQVANLSTMLAIQYAAGHIMLTERLVSQFCSQFGFLYPGSWFSHFWLGLLMNDSLHSPIDCMHHSTIVLSFQI